MKSWKTIDIYLQCNNTFWYLADLTYVTYLLHFNTTSMIHNLYSIQIKFHFKAFLLLNILKMLFIYLKNEFSLSYSKYACTKQAYCWLTTGLIWHLSPPTPKPRFSPRWPIWQILKCQTNTMFRGVMFCCVNKSKMTNSRRV